MFLLLHLKQRPFKTKANLKQSEYIRKLTFHDLNGITDRSQSRTRMVCVHDITNTIIITYSGM